jgi:hypothetical protein
VLAAESKSDIVVLISLPELRPDGGFLGDATSWKISRAGKKYLIEGT